MEHAAIALGRVLCRVGRKGVYALTAHPTKSSSRRKLPAFGFRQQQGRGDQDAVGQDREHADRLAKRELRTQQPDEGRIERRNAASKIVGETLARTADRGWEVLGEERPHPGEDARGKEAEREA